jgi:hypothetical protein
MPFHYPVRLDAAAIAAETRKRPADDAGGTFGFDKRSRTAGARPDGFARGGAPPTGPRASFRSDATPGPLVCVICLGPKDRHDVEHCERTRTWDGVHATASKRNHNNRVVLRTDGREPCFQFNLGRCHSTEHGEKHVCSACGSKSPAHNAQRCPWLPATPAAYSA